MAILHEIRFTDSCHVVSEQVYEQEFVVGQMVNEWYVVEHHNPDKPLYVRIYADFKPDDFMPWGGVQVRDTRDNWVGWQRVWPNKG